MPSTGKTNGTVIMKERQKSIDGFFGMIDSDTPFDVQLKGVYKKSGAFRSLSDRLPVILTKVIDSLSREKDEIVQKNAEAAEELKLVIGRVSKLKNELVTNKPLVPLIYSTHQNETNSDIVMWNNYLAERTQLEGRVPTWFNTVELFSECYLYRRLMEAFYLTDSLYTYDPFAKLKQESFLASTSSIVAVATHTLDLIDRSQDISQVERKREFSKLMRVELWGNRCDLSMSAGSVNGQMGNPLEQLASLEEDILIDDTESAWDILTKARSSNKPITVDIVLDNAGYEFATDICAAAFLIAHKLADKVRFYVKSLPWFISDVTKRDFHWVIENMITASNPKLSELGKLVKGYIKTGLWTVEDERFWTSPFAFNEMPQRDPVLYAKLSEATLIIIKGDLNYRKLVGDINWEYSTSIYHALQGFLPSNLLALRSMKSDTNAGMKPQQGQIIGKTDPMWMFTGQYGFIQTAIKDSS